MKKPLLILQKHDFLVESTEYNKQEGTMILEGTFAVFDKVNNNSRIYEAAAYLPHLKYLQEKAKRKKLYGEIDHPDRFDVALSKASHLVESIWHDPKTNTIKGRVKLLKTKYGEHIKGIIESGGVVSISSRSAGSVNESTRKVDIKRIFTYDFVGEGGFGNSAELSLVNESFNVEDPNVSIYEVSDEFIANTKEPEIKSFINEMLVELNPEDQGVLNETKYIDKDSNKQKQNTMKENFVTKEQMKGYSEMVKENFDNLKNKVNELSKGTTDKKLLENYNEVKAEISKIIEYSEHIAENFNNNETTVEKLKSFVNYLAENLNKVINYSDYLSSTIGKDIQSLREENEKIIQYSNYIAENVENNIKYSEYLAEGLNDVVDHNDYIAENVNKNRQYSEYLAEHINNNIEYSEYVAENVNKAIQYSEYLAENVNKNIEYSEYVAENVNKAIEYSNYISENLDKSIQYSEYIAENALPSLPNKEVNESLSEKMTSFLTSVEKQKTEINKKKHLTSFLTEANQEKFEKLPETDKQKVLVAVLENQCQNEEDVLKVWEQVLTTPERARLKFIFEHMPASVKAGWDNLDEAKQHKLLEKSKFFDLSSSIKVKDFWMKSGLIQKESPLDKINESLSQSSLYSPSNDSKDTTKKLGYSIDRFKDLL